MESSFRSTYPANQLAAEQVRQLLGTPTGYADDDEDPACLIGPPTVESKYGDAYLPIFVTDRTTGRVLETRLVPEVKTQGEKRQCMSLASLSIGAVSRFELPQ